jgi:tRNA threonylcarbamoyladenosine biosynthesis protein TsaB
VLAERAERTSSNHAGTLPRLVEETLQEGGGLERGDAIAVTNGPGSFTGLRIAMSFAKGLAFAGHHRLVGVPTLDALALVAPTSESRICAVLDARKREVYAALYERAGGRLMRCGEPCAIAAERLAAAVGSPCAFIGDAVDVYGEIFRRVLGDGVLLFPPSTHPPSAIAVARLAASRLARSPAGDDIASLSPTYVRPPEAELTQSAHSPSPESAIRRNFVDKIPVVY